MTGKAIPLIECVPNFSEGRDPGVLGALTEAIESVRGARLLDRHADPHHHRSVFTIAGAPESVLAAAFRAVRTAVQQIDMREHRGAHMRIGAADVVPFVPLGAAPMSTCIELARRLGQIVADQLEVPVYLYGDAARGTLRPTVAALRRPQFEGLGDRIGTDPEFAPDFGPAHLHPTAGATAVGARCLLVAYNIVLASADVGLAESIARTIRASSGGLAFVQARGFRVGGMAQVSMNLLDIDVTPPVVVFDLVQQLAHRAGVAIGSSEFVGLVPERAVPAHARERLRLNHAAEPRMLERRLTATFGRTK